MGQHRLSEALSNAGRAALAAPRRLLGRRRSSAPATTVDFDPTRARQGEFWALKDVSFEVKQGEVVGIIGRNGAGKSTLLKILSRITEPTSGRFGVRGRVGSLLEVGAGFHPELTGRENIFLSGTLLGMTRAEIKRRFDEIVAFAEIDQFLDTPVKRYSSGMYVRLGFAVAAHLQPEILIVDEVLAVGDAQFQKKCLGKMGDVAASGRTVLFVSHNMAAVRALCKRGVVLDRGSTACIGTPAEAIERYRGDSGTDQCGSRRWSWNEAPGTEAAKLLEIDIAPERGTLIDIESGVRVSLKWFNSLEDANVDCTLRIVTSEDVVVLQRGTVVSEGRDSRRGVYEVTTTLPPNLLNGGVYRVGVLFGRDRTELLAQVDDVTAFEVQNTAQGMRYHRSPGVIRPALPWGSRFVGPSLDEHVRAAEAGR
jgi:lipopolysaccharide transport system ATP-binding protein